MSENCAGAPKKKPELLILAQGMAETCQMSSTVLERLYQVVARIVGDVAPPLDKASQEEPAGSLKQSAYWLSRIRSNISEANAVLDQLESHV